MVARPSALVCFPYAGGNAVNFQPMAQALRGSGLAVYAVELPGHDVAATSESFVPMEQVVDQVVAEITARGLKEVLLWGHSSGAALAVETAKRLQDRGVERPAGVPRCATARCRRRPARQHRRADRRSNADIVTDLSADSGYTELGELDAQRAEHVGAAYRHDCVSAYRYFADVLENPPAGRLSAPVTVVVAADDPSRRGSAYGTATGSCWPNTSSCTNFPTAATTSCVPVQPRRHRPCCGAPNCWLFSMIRQ